MPVGRHVLIVIASYNRAHFLPEALDSALAQDYSLKKIVVVDDGSDDGTRELCAQYVGKHKGIVSYYYQGNSGCAAARNHGLVAIDDDVGFVCFLDSDDRLLAGKLAREVALLDRHSDRDFTYSDAVVYDESAGTEELHQVAAAGDPDQFAIQHFLTNEAKTAALLYRVNAVRGMRFREDMRYNEDSEFLQRVALKFRGIYSPEPGCWVRWHGGSKSRNSLEILKAVLGATRGIAADHPDFYRTHKDVIDLRLQQVQRELALQLLLAECWDDARHCSPDWLFGMQAKLHFAGYYRLRRTINLWLANRFGRRKK